MSSYTELLGYSKQLERRLSQLERQDIGVNVAGGDHGALAGLGDDDHTQYLLASAAGGRTAFAANWTDLTDGGATTLHSHATPDHGALTGLGDDDHTQYLLASAGGGRTPFAANWTDLTDAGATTLHKHDHGGMDGLGDDDHAAYLLASAAGGRTTFGTNWTDLTDAGATSLHKHDHGGMDGLGDDDHTQYLLASGLRSAAQSGPQLFTNAVFAAGGIIGSNSANGDLVINGTSDATKTSSFVLLQPNGGNVGIGTNAPGAALEVYGSSPSIWVRDSGAAGAVAVMQATNALISLGASYFNSAVPLAIVSGGAEKIRITTTGDVGIGTGTPGAKLEVYGSSPSIWVRDSGAAGAIAVTQATNTLVSMGASYTNSAVPLAIVSGGAEKIRITTTGDVGIGTNSPNGKLQIEGKVGIKTGVNAIDGQLFIYQDSSTGSCAVLDLAQEDVSEEFINFKAANGTGNPIDTAALGTYYGKVRVAVNGTFKWLAVYN